LTAAMLPRVMISSKARRITCPLLSSITFLLFV
jgi:hypothetical protein